MSHEDWDPTLKSLLRQGLGEHSVPKAARSRLRHRMDNLAAGTAVAMTGASLSRGASARLLFTTLAQKPLAALAISAMLGAGAGGLAVSTVPALTERGVSRNHGNRGGYQVNLEPSRAPREMPNAVLLPAAPDGESARAGSFAPSPSEAPPLASARSAWSSRLPAPRGDSVGSVESHALAFSGAAGAPAHELVQSSPMEPPALEAPVWEAPALAAPALAAPASSGAASPASPLVHEDAATAPPSVVPSAARSPTQRDWELAAERQIIDSARKFLSAREYTSALSLAEAHGRSFPRGRLSEERDALLIHALCGLGRASEGRARAEGFSRVYPASMLLPGLRQAVTAQGLPANF